MSLRLLLVIVLLAPTVPARAAPPRSNPTADALYQSALRRLTHSSIETRRGAISDLEQATLISPGNPTYELLLARVYYECGFLKYAQRRYERVARMAPQDADGRFGLGQVWRRDWLKYLEKPSLDRSIENFSAAAKLRPRAADAWIQLVPLLLDRGDVRPALDAATHAVDAEPQRPEAVLALAHVTYRSGGVHAADSLFRAAIPRLPRLARTRFEDISPVASPSDTFTLHRLSASDQRAFVERFWRDNDPDLTSPENEARLEYWSRVAQAYFLYFDPKRREWDERGEIYVRYGPAERVMYNPLPDLLDEPNTDGRVRFGPGTFRYINAAFPMNVLLWKYPKLGMTVRLEDRSLSEYYLLPMSVDLDPDPRPDPDSLARRGDQLALTDGRGVFPKLPPGVTPLRVTGHIARFSGDRGPRLVADVETPGGPSDSLRAEWVVLDSARAEVARGVTTLAPSACAPTEVRVADFAKDLPPGPYLVGITVREGESRRGVYRTEVSLPPDSEQLALSDVVVSCGTPPIGAGPGVRIEPNARGLVSPGGMLTAYFEIYHLSVDGDGQSRFEYDCVVRSAERDPRIWVKRLFAPRPRIPEIATRRAAENVGPLRRQFVSVPVGALPPGRYRLDITVRDLVAGREITAGAPFLKPVPGAPTD